MSHGCSRLFRLSGGIPSADNDKRFTGEGRKTANDSGTDCGAVKRRSYAIRTLKDQAKTLSRFPVESPALRAVCADSVARMGRG